MNLIVGAANTDFLDRCLYCNTNWLKQHYGNNGRGNWGNVKYQSKKIVESHDSCNVIVGNKFSDQKACLAVVNNQFPVITNYNDKIRSWIPCLKLNNRSQ